VELLFEADQRGLDPLALAEERWAEAAMGGSAADDVPRLPAYAVALVRGVAAHDELIWEWIDTYARGWSRDRMPAVDRAILALGAYEVVYEDDVPDQVVLAEAADLASKLSTDKSADFVSGVLGRISDMKAGLR
jgi:N utilization substance protein B